MPPNILWMMTDEQRCDSLGCYGSSWARTPVLDRLATGGTLFENAITPAPVCVPARRSILTGQGPPETGVWYNHDAPQCPTFLTRPFREAGYATASFGKQHYGCRTSRAFEHEEQIVLSNAVHYFHYAEPYRHEVYDVIRYPEDGRYPWIFGGRFPESSDRTSEARAVERAIRWLRSLPASTPFFLRVSFNGPHTPVAPPAPYDRLIREEDIRLPPEAEPLPPSAPNWLREVIHPKAGAFRLTAAQIRAMRRYYYGEVAFLDSMFGRVLEEIGRIRALDDTIIVFVSDHGTHLGDCGLVQKQTFYEPVVTVPFFIRFPGTIPAGARIRTPVETRSLLPTLLELCGLDLPGQCARLSLRPDIENGEGPPLRPVFSAFTTGSFGERHTDRLGMVRFGDWKLTLCADPAPTDVTLVNLAEDPCERTNLAGRPEVRATERELRTLLLDHLTGQDTKPPAPAGVR